MAFGVPYREGGLDTPIVGCLIGLHLFCFFCDSNSIFLPSAGSKAVKKNGATAVIPGSHRWPLSRGPKVEEVEHAEMDPRSALICLGSAPIRSFETRQKLTWLQQPTTARAQTCARRTIP